MFCENNVQKRRKFFADRLIQHLWEVFIEARPDMTIGYLRRLRSNPMDGEYRYQMIVTDMV